MSVEFTDLNLAVSELVGSGMLGSGLGYTAERLLHKISSKLIHNETICRVLEITTIGAMYALTISLIVQAAKENRLDLIAPLMPLVGFLEATFLISHFEHYDNLLN